MAQRSPILGYNHNVNYRGLVFHVQTEDSGVDNPHVFTHLFQGGVILTTRKLEYDATVSENVVKSLMQSQHKAILKSLRRGEFDEKIDSYLGTNPKLRPRGEKPPATEPSLADEPAASTDAAQPSPAAADEVAAADADKTLIARPLSANLASVPTPAPSAPAMITPPAIASAPAAGPSGPPARPSRPLRTPSNPNIRPRRHARPGTAGHSLVRPAPPPVDAGDDSPARSRSGEVVVSRPPIVVDSNSRPGLRPPPRAREEQRGSIFDRKIITEKSLDEVILAYLSEDSED